MTLIIFLFFLSLLIFIHELGHFLAAKKVGLQVNEFSLGFPPRLFSRKIKDTVYSLGLILFGGFVKLRGEDDPDDKLGFWYLSPLKRFLIVISGILFNIFLAYFLISLSLLLGYPQESNRIFVAGFLSPNSQGAKYFKIGDEILKVKIGDEFYQFKTPIELSEFLKKHKGNKVEIIFLRDGKELKAEVIPPIGFYIANFVLVKKSFPQNFYLGFVEILKAFKKIFTGFVIGISSLFKEAKVDLEIVGPIGIYNLFDNFKNFGLGYILYFVAILSLNLAIINSLPIPALDGGRAIFIFVEIIRRKRISLQTEELIHKIGFIFLFTLLVIITFKDITKLWLK
jgi:regulator of sigma E protease